MAKTKTAKYAPVASLQTDWRIKKLENLRGQIANGMSPNDLSQEQRDFLHMQTSEENVLYWKAENEHSETDERCLRCQSITRSMIVALRAKDPPIKD